MRLLDRIRTTWSLTQIEYLKTMFFHNTKPIVIVADEIAEQIDILPDDTAHPQSDDFKNVAPPFDHFFIEAQTTLTEKNVTTMTQRGLYVINHAWKDAPPIHRKHKPEGTKYTLTCASFHYIHVTNIIIHYPATFTLHLDEYGYILDDLQNIQVFTRADIKAIGISQDQLLYHLTNPLVFSLKALEALHQKGEVIHYTPPRNVKRRFMRKYDLEPSEHYTLTIKPGKPRKLSDIEPEKGTGKKKGLHIVRGHFTGSPSLR